MVHRMAFAADRQGRGLSTEAFKLIDEACLSMGIRYIRIDTAPDNKRMQHVKSHSHSISSLGYSFLIFQKLFFISQEISEQRPVKTADEGHREAAVQVGRFCRSFAELFLKY